MDRFLTIPRILAALAVAAGILVAIPALGGDGWSGVVIVGAVIIVLGFFGAALAGVNRLDRL